MLKVSTTGVPAVILRTGSCSTPQAMARYHPHRQSRKAITQPSSSRARKGIRTISSSLVGAARGRIFECDELRILRSFAFFAALDDGINHSRRRTFRGGGRGDGGAARGEGRGARR